MAKKKGGNIWVGVISHRHGLTVYAGRTKTELFLKLGEYAEEWWDSEIPDLPMPQHPKTVKQAEKFVDSYFGSVEHEWVEIHECEL